MKVEFAFEIKDRVTTPSGIEATVTGFFLGKYNQKQVLAEFINKETGALMTEWLDEDQVKVIA